MGPFIGLVNIVAGFDFLEYFLEALFFLFAVASTLGQMDFETCDTILSATE